MSRRPFRVRSSRRARLRLVSLEDRAVPATSAAFDLATGKLALAGDGSTSAVHVTVASDGFVQVTMDGQAVSADPLAIDFSAGLAGATGGTLSAIALTGGGNRDRLELDNLTVGGGITVTSDGAIDVLGRVRAAGRVLFSATDQLVVEHAASVRSVVGGNGGVVSLAGGVISQGGRVMADGVIGGTVTVDGTSVLNYGLTSAAGRAGGGTVIIRFTSHYLETTAARILVSGAAGDGGIIRIDGGTTGSVYASGQDVATGRIGGEVDALGEVVRLAGSIVDASGAAGGGHIRIGGGFHGADPTVTNAQTTSVGAETVLRADATASGAGGTVVVWADGSTSFSGRISARGVSVGGSIEVSGKGNLDYAGTAAAPASAGSAGKLLLDPKNLVISDTTTADRYPYYDLLNPAPSPGGEFGSQVVPLPSGHIVVVDPYANVAGAYSGAVYLFNGMTGALISSFVGQSADDEVGYSGVTVLANGNFVIDSPFASVFGTQYSGAVTWGSGTTGVSGAINYFNSLFGSHANDELGLRGIFALTGSAGNYVIDSPNFNGNRGAVTWQSGTSPSFGFFYGVDSVLGSTPSDSIGENNFNLLAPPGVVLLSNGDYVVDSPGWHNGSGAVVGAVTWVNGTNGETINNTNNTPVSTANSIYGTLANDDIGSGGVYALANSNYVIDSPAWSFSLGDGRGSYALGNGAGQPGMTFDSMPRLSGQPGENLGSGGVVALPNGNFVVDSPDTNQGSLAHTGTVICDTGTYPLSFSSITQIFGTAANDQVGLGGVYVVGNNFVIDSDAWHGNLGAVTWVNGALGNSAQYIAVGAGNSLIGQTANDYIGDYGITVLSNNNYVVGSGNYTDPATSHANAGAATWCSGAGPTAAIVSPTNSLVGTTANEYLGSLITALKGNGNYVVDDYRGSGGRGLVTWGSGASGVAGYVSTGNSLAGTSTSDTIGLPIFAGSPGVVPLSDGNYVVLSPRWSNNGTSPNEGTATWATGIAPTAATVSQANSLVGAYAGDNVGTAAVALSGGSYLVLAGNAAAPAGAPATVGATTWVSGTTHLPVDGVNVDNATNSVFGQSTPPFPFGPPLTKAVYDPINNTFITPFQFDQGGTVRVGLLDPNQLTYARGTGQTITTSTAFITQSLSAGTDVVLQASNDITVDSPIVVNNPSGNGGHLTLLAGRSITLNANISTDKGALTLIANDGLADGVIDADRDSGPASLTMINNAIIDCGFGALDVELLSGYGNMYSDVGRMELNYVKTIGNLKLVSWGPVTTDNPLVVGGSTSISAASDVQLTHHYNKFGGPVTIPDALGNVALATSGPIQLGTVYMGGNLSIQADGAITQTGPITLSGSASFVTTGGAGITINNPANDFRSALSLVTSGASSVSDANTLILGNVTVGGTLTIQTAGPLTDSGPIAVGGSTSLNAANGPITLDSPGNNFVGPVTVTGNSAVTLVADNGLTLGAGNLSSLTVTAGGQLWGAGALTVSGPTAITAGSIALQYWHNDFGGPLSLHASADASVQDVNSLTLGPCYVGGNLSVAAGDVSQSGALGVVGSMQVVALPGTITLTDPGNFVIGPVTLTTLGNVAVYDIATLTLGPLVLSPGQTATLTTNGQPVTIAGTVKLLSGSILSATAGITVADGGTLSGAGQVTVGTGPAGLQMQAGGTLQPVMATLTVNGDAALSAGSNFDVAISDPNDFSVLAVHGAVSLGGATLNLNIQYAPALGDAVTIVRNDGTDPISGKFANGPVVTAGGAKWVVNTAGGDGNDVGLTAGQVGLNDNLPVLFGVPVSANIDEQTTLTFNATATDLDPGQTLTFSLVNAPAGATIDPATGAFTWTPTEAQGPDTYVFHVRVSDGIASIDDSITVFVNEVNTAPALSGVPAAATTAPGSTVAFTATATDPDLIHGRPNALTFSLVGAPTGAVIDPDTGAFTWTPGDFNPAGTYVFKVRVADDGVPSLSDSTTITVRVKPAAVVNGDLLVGGTPANDSITVNFSKDLSQLIVTLNRAVVGTFPTASVTGKIVAHGLSGNDTITISPKVTKVAWLFGDTGNDKLTGGGGNNLLVGGDGNDVLSARFGTNVLIGGDGADRLTGGSGDDLLIAGATAYDADLAALANIVTEWTSANPYAQRIADLTSGVNGTALTAATVQDDAVKDTLSGKTGADWFIVSATDKVADLDTKLPEVKTVI